MATEVSNGYITTEALALRLGSDGDAVDGYGQELTDAVNTSSRAIDQWTGRRFWLDSSATAKQFGYDDIFVDERGRWTVRIKDASAITTVETDDGDTGTWTATTLYFAEPVNLERHGIEGWPYDTIVGVSGQQWRRTGDRPSVKVTATWGWAAVPETVRQACVLLSKDEFKRRTQGLGDVAGIGDYAVRIRANSHARELLQPFCLTGGLALGGVA